MTWSGFLAGLVAAALPASLAAQDIELPTLPEVESFEDTFTLPEPITVLDANGNPQAIMGMEDGRLVIEFPNMPGAQALIPVDDKGIYFAAQLPANYNDLVVASNEGRFESFLREMKSLARPLSRFLMIPPRKTNFHGLVERYYEGLASVGDLDEAVEFTLDMPWSALSEDFYPLAERLAYRLIENDRPDLTESLLARLFIAIPEQDFAEMAFRIADALRTQGQHELSTRIYGSLSRSSDEVLRQRSLLWAGYSSAVAGDADRSRRILNSIQELERGDENFLTYCLARGRLGYADKDVREGLRYLSRAMVLTSIEATFKPELYYLLILGYRESGEEEAADRLAREFEIFYPENRWLQKYRSETSIL